MATSVVVLPEISSSPPAHSTVSVVITRDCYYGCVGGRKAIRGLIVSVVCIEAVINRLECEAMKPSARQRGQYRGYMPLHFH